MRNAQKEQVDFIVGKNRIMLEILNAAQRAAEKNTSILITGLTGTGKEVLARYIHKIGPRAGKTLVDINCAAIQSTVLESELFGYEAGAFTGADKRKLGLMEVADGGILFLDEISSMPVEIQAKLLRAIEEQSFRRVGGATPIRVDVQILAASNRDLPTMVKEGIFRADLYYRLKVLDLHLPPLCARKEDIPELVGLFLRKMAPEKGANITDITPKAMEALMVHDWPGNIRELKNVIERAILFCDEASIDIQHLPPDLIYGSDKYKQDDYPVK
jgi:two-component system, NtrC family, response regulator AtoC